VLSLAERRMRRSAYRVALGLMGRRFPSEATTIALYVQAIERENAVLLARLRRPEADG